MNSDGWRKTQSDIKIGEKDKQYSSFLGKEY
jgi:hypothetical protein